MLDTYVLTYDQISRFNIEGYLVIENIIDKKEIEVYRSIYDLFLENEIDAGNNRSDLGAGLGQSSKSENITQIMWPSDFVPELLFMPYHLRTLAIAREILGEDMDMDFDMLINKAPGSNTATPWHQDAAYWITMPDKRAISCWLALDQATLNNGCMWYIPGSHLRPLRVHTHAGNKGGALVCPASEDEGVFIEVQPGSCILHHGATLHYSRGNSTDTNRRALITNFRPKAMIELERSRGFDHGRSGNAGDRTVRNNEFK